MSEDSAEMQNLVNQLRQLSAQPLMDRYSSVIKDMTNPTFILPMLEMDLMRVREMNIDGEIKLVKYGEPLLNEQGVNNILARVRPLLTSNSVLNNLTEEQVSKLVLSLADDLIRELMINGKRYGIEKISDKDLIIGTIILPVYLTLNRSLREGERDFWRNKPPENALKPSIFNPFSRGGA